MYATRMVSDMKEYNTDENLALETKSSLRHVGK